MRLHTFIWYAILFWMVLSSCNEQSLPGNQRLNGEFLGQPVPNDSVQLFGEGTISTHLDTRDIAISPDGKEIFYTLRNPSRATSYSVIMHMFATDSGWTAPKIASFSGEYADLEPFIAPGGNRLYFVSNRPKDTQDSISDWDIWFVTKQGGRWQNPTNVGQPINTDQDEFYPSVALNGNLYFTTTRSNGIGKEDIFCAPFKDGEFGQPLPLDLTINSTGFEYNAYIAPDESYLIFGGYGRKGGLGGGDLYISLKEDGVWQSAVALPKGMNSSALDYSPFVSPDGKYLFFTSNRIYKKDPDVPWNTKSYLDMLTGPQNGLQSIYWVAIDDYLKVLKKN